MKLRTKAKSDNTVTEREIRNRQIAYDAATESIVLLKNEGALPITPSKVALYGIGAAINIKGGTGSGEVNERHCIGIKEGLENGGFTVTTNDWLDEYKKEYEEGKTAYGKELVKKLFSTNADDSINIMANPYHYPFGRMLNQDDLNRSNSDTCIYVVSRQAGECSDRSMEHYDYNIAKEEIHNIKMAASFYKKLIIVINVGSSIDLSELESIEGIGAIIFFCQQGMEGGRALTDVLTGKVTPSGCLTDTWGLKYTDFPFADQYSYLNGNIVEEDYKEGIYVGYRYFDSFSKRVRYEFGYGLSYTDFKIEPVGVTHDNSKIIVQAKVTNIGSKFAGKKVVQLYVSCPEVDMEKEFQSLAAFGKTKVLAPSESQIITLELDMELLASYQEKTSEFILEKGDYFLRLGESSRKTVVCAVVTLPESVVVEKCCSICPPQNKIELLKNDAKTKNHDTIAVVPKLSLDRSNFSKVVHTYEKDELQSNAKVEELFSSLTEKEKLKMIMGTGFMDRNPVFTVPGSAAYSASLPEKNIANMVFCDGPAGIRLQKTSVLMKNGKLKPVEPMMEFLGYLPKYVKMFMLGNPKKGKLLYQYATAFPVGTALAQTWNMELLERVGEAVGTEMKEYGVTYWLAPGMNIHRNPLCGRNYEYFSEDPILTGRCAAAITRGVQKHDGSFVTLKHFAANNQETNRSHVSSNISERVLREIYLKGFMIAVRESHAKGVMTGYNRINGFYTSTSEDLVTKVLRKEWGFEGLVMTDWFATGKGLASNGETIRAGVDILMPGGKKYMKAVKEDLKNGVVKQQDIDIACKRVLSAVVQSGVF